MRFEFIAKHRGIWPVWWICEALGVSRSGFHAWRVRALSKRARSDEAFGARVRGSFIYSYRTDDVVASGTTFWPKAFHVVCIASNG
jgi:putative transposase